MPLNRWKTKHQCIVGRNVKNRIVYCQKVVRFINLHCLHGSQHCVEWQPDFLQLEICVDCRDVYRLNCRQMIWSFVNCVTIITPCISNINCCQNLRYQFQFCGNISFNLVCSLFIFPVKWNVIFGIFWFIWYLSVAVFILQNLWLHQLYFYTCIFLLLVCINIMW